MIGIPTIILKVWGYMHIDLLPELHVTFFSKIFALPASVPSNFNINLFYERIKGLVEKRTWRGVEG